MAISGEASAISVERRRAVQAPTACASRSSAAARGAAAHQQAELLAARFGRFQRRRQLAVEHHRDAVGDLGQFVEILADDQHRGAAGGEIDQRLADRRRRTGVHAPGRLADNQHAGLAQDFAADDEFLQIAAGEAHGFGIALGLAHVESLGGAVDVGSVAGLLMKPRLTMPLAAWPVSSAFSDKLHARRGAVAEPFLGHEGRAKAAPLGDRDAGRLAVDDNGAALGASRSPDNAAKQFVLAVAGDAGDAQDLAALHFERDLLEPHAMRIIRLER